MTNKRSRPPAADNLQLGAPTLLSLADELFRRRKLQTIFISSEMRSRSLNRARRVAADAVRRTRIAEPWLWEDSVYAGPYVSEEICVRQAANSQGLVLIIDQVITPITRKEYRAARANGVPVYVMAMARKTRPAQVQRFLQRERKHAGPGTIDIPTPHGLPVRALLVLSQNGAWLDHRPLDFSSIGITHEPPPLADRVANLIAQGEGPTAEFKVRLPQEQGERRELAATVAAFANGSGGTLVYGVENETLSVVGVEPSPADLDGLHRSIRDRVDPQPTTEVHVVELDGRKVVAVVVEPGPVPPYGDNPAALDVYVRRGANTVRARSDDYRALSAPKNLDAGALTSSAYGLQGRAPL